MKKRFILLIGLCLCGVMVDSGLTDFGQDELAFTSAPSVSATSEVDSSAKTLDLTPEDPTLIPSTADSISPLALFPVFSHEFAEITEESAYVAPATPVMPEVPYATEAQSFVPPAPNFTVTINTPEIIAENLSPSDIYRFRKLVYAHNTILGALHSFAPGQTFTLTENGVTTSYQVSAVVTYANTESGLDGQPDLMGRIAYSALGHSVALMTCAGTPYGNGNATHRIVVFADQL